MIVQIKDLRKMLVAQYRVHNKAVDAYDAQHKQIEADKEWDQCRVCWKLINAIDVFLTVSGEKGYRLDGE